MRVFSIFPVFGCLLAGSARGSITTDEADMVRPLNRWITEYEVKESQLLLEVADLMEACNLWFIDWENRQLGEDSQPSTMWLIPELAALQLAEATLRQFVQHLKDLIFRDYRDLEVPDVLDHLWSAPAFSTAYAEFLTFRNRAVSLWQSFRVLFTSVSSLRLAYMNRIDYFVRIAQDIHWSSPEAYNEALSVFTLYAARSQDFFAHLLEPDFLSLGDIPSTPEYTTIVSLVSVVESRKGMINDVSGRIDLLYRKWKIGIARINHELARVHSRGLSASQSLLDLLAPQGVPHFIREWVESIMHEMALIVEDGYLTADMYEVLLARNENLIRYIPPNQRTWEIVHLVLQMRQSIYSFILAIKSLVMADFKANILKSDITTDVATFRNVVRKQANQDGISRRDIIQSLDRLKETVDSENM